MAYKILKLYLKELFIDFAHKAVEAPVSMLILPNEKRKRGGETKRLTAHIYFECILEHGVFADSSMLIVVTSWLAAAPQQLQMCNLKGPTFLPPFCLCCHFGANWLTQASFKC